MKTPRTLPFIPEIPLVFSSFLLNFFWEMVQTPLYDDVPRKTYLQILISRLHCTLGDVLILALRINLFLFWYGGIECGIIIGILSHRNRRFGLKVAIAAS